MFTKNENIYDPEHEYVHKGVKYISIHVKPGDFEGGKQILYSKAAKFLKEENCDAATRFEITHENIVEWASNTSDVSYPVVQYMLMTASFDYGILVPKNKA